jgi:hypothetical protein
MRTKIILLVSCLLVATMIGSSALATKKKPLRVICQVNVQSKFIHDAYGRSYRILSKKGAKVTIAECKNGQWTKSVKKGIDALKALRDDNMVVRETLTIQNQRKDVAVATPRYEKHFGKGQKGEAPEGPDWKGPGNPCSFSGPCGPAPVVSGWNGTWKTKLLGVIRLKKTSNEKVKGTFEFSGGNKGVIECTFKPGKSDEVKGYYKYTDHSSARMVGLKSGIIIKLYPDGHIGISARGSVFGGERIHQP